MAKANKHTTTPKKQRGKEPGKGLAFIDATRRRKVATAPSSATPSSPLMTYQQALDLTPAGDHEQRGIIESQLGLVYYRAGDTREALRHYQQAIQQEEARGDIYGAGRARYNIALLHAEVGRIGDAILYARAALDNYQQAGPGAATDVAEAEQLIAGLNSPTADT